MAIDVYKSALTKRLVVPEAEKRLFDAMGLPMGQQVTLIDYQGGDEMIERVATAGYGAEAFGLSQSQLFEHMAAVGSQGPLGLASPFNFAQAKVRIVSSIYNSLRLVHSPDVNVNEESLRYSQARGTFTIPSPERLMAADPKLSEADAIKAHRVIRQMTAEAYMDYSELVDDNEATSMSLARELSRLPLNGDSHTGYYLKLTLWDAAAMIKAGEAMGPDAQGYGDLVAAIKDTFSTIAPGALEAILSGGKTHDFTFPNLVDSHKLTEAGWEPSMTRRLVNEGFEQYLFSRMNHGEVSEGEMVGSMQAIDYMGDDSSIAQAARVSYSKGTTTVRKDRGLIRYLYANGHTSPFEMVELAVEGSDPWFSVPRQMGRHRTLDMVAGALGQLVPGGDFYIPKGEMMAYQSSDNKQGRSGPLSDTHRARAELIMENQDRLQKSFATQLNNLGVSQDVLAASRSMAYRTPWAATSDAHNWFNLDKLRNHSHAQAEVRVLAENLAKVVTAGVPVAYQAYEDFRKNALTFSAQEIDVLRELANLKVNGASDLENLGMSGEENKRARDVLFNKIRRLM